MNERSGASVEMERKLGGHALQACKACMREDYAYALCTLLIGKQKRLFCSLWSISLNVLCDNGSGVVHFTLIVTTLK